MFLSALPKSTISGVSAIGTAIAVALVAAISLSAAPAIAQSSSSTIKPTIVLVHGAFAESSSWDGVVPLLQARGYRTIAAANPLRAVKSDADYVSEIIRSVPGPVVLAGHSYGGHVITGAATFNANVKALVYVAAFAPEAGESAADLSSRYPGSTLGPTLAPPVPLNDGGNDLYIQQDKFAAQFAADLPPEVANLMAVSQRPVTDTALKGTVKSATWKSLPSWSIYGANDKNIPPAMLAFMAKRANSKKTVVVANASHVVMVSHPKEVADLIIEAADSVTQYSYSNRTLACQTTTDQIRPCLN